VNQIPVTWTDVSDNTVCRTGLAGHENVQGEEVKKLDELSNDIFINALRSSGKVSVMVSEENEREILVEGPMRGKYCVVFDPLDGGCMDCGYGVGVLYMIVSGGRV
jgi:fructose-1,6-bisphosphatase I